VAGVGRPSFPVVVNATTAFRVRASHIDASLRSTRRERRLNQQGTLGQGPQRLVHSGNGTIATGVRGNTSTLRLRCASSHGHQSPAGQSGTHGNDVCRHRSDVSDTANAERDRLRLAPAREGRSVQPRIGLHARSKSAFLPAPSRRRAPAVISTDPALPQRHRPWRQTRGVSPQGASTTMTVLAASTAAASSHTAALARDFDGYCDAGHTITVRVAAAYATASPTPQEQPHHEHEDQEYCSRHQIQG
jgi:hypothetical protein